MTPKNMKNRISIFARKILLPCIVLLLACPPFSRGTGKLSVRSQENSSGPLFYVSGSYPGTLEAEFRLTKAVNVKTEPPLPARIIIPPGQEVKAFSLSADRPGLSMSYAYTYRAVVGDPRAEPDPAPYLPPFESGRRFRIGRGFHPDAARSDPFNAYSVSILMPGGAAVCAARSGILTETDTRSFRRQTVQGIMEMQSRLIRIQHDDGTMGLYAHLDPDSCSLSPGTRIKAGQIIARLGKNAENGLFFTVQKNAGMRLVSLPFRFAAEGGTTVVPVRGMVLHAAR
ncbi:MAG: M23 family metallopeptidase [Desulfococcaceae bacterium]|jgi:murein DD-endopeptidase MepM/ murein hydrolase activator NlpD|nr:M23 family metallopeptidase [Desulfococcaceae bacterium]